MGRSFLDAASSLDANIDAAALVDRLAAADAEPMSQKTQKAISELKDLVRRAPLAVIATPGAVLALLRVVNRLAQSCGTDDEDDGVETLQDALEALGILLGESKGGASAPSAASAAVAGAGRTASSGKATTEDAAAERRGLEVAELALRSTENGKQLLRILSSHDVSTQYDAMVVLQRIYCRLPEPINSALLADPMSLNCLMGILQNSHIDYVRNEALSFLLLLTVANAELQQIFTMQGLPETVFAMLKEEGLGTGGKVARDLIRCLSNLVGNATCQRCIRETSGLSALVSSLSDALRGSKPLDADEGEEEDDDFVTHRLDVPEEARWACFLLLADVALAFAGQGAASGVSGGGGSSSSTAAASRQGGPPPEAAQNCDALVRHGALELLRHLPDASLSLDAKLKLVRLLEAFQASPLAAKQLDHLEGAAGGAAPLLPTLAAVIVGEGAPPALRSALGRALGRTVATHSQLQLGLLTSMSPQLEAPEPDEAVPMGRQVVGLLEKAALNRVEPQQLWFAFHLVLAMLWGNPSVQGALPTMRIAIASGEEPAEQFLDLLLMAFSACARKCLDVSPDGDDEDFGLSEAGIPQDPRSPAAALVAVLKLLAYWLSHCSAALSTFAGSAVMVPRAMELILLGEKCGPFFRVQVEGLASLIMGVCINAEKGIADVPSLMALVANRVGIEEFQNKIERLFRSEAIQRPPRGRGSFRWYGAKFRAFVREQQQSVQRRMVQLYVSEGIGGGGAALSEDVADQYKQLIRVQDEKFREVQKENEQLRAEVEAFMRRSLQASSAAVLERLEAMTKENEALHREVEQFERESRQQAARSQRELRQCRVYIAELEQQRASMAMGYEQVERTSEELRLEAQRLRTALSAAERVAQGKEDELTLARVAETAQQQAEELRSEKTDLLELLGSIVAACPEASRFVAPLAITFPPLAAAAAGAGAGTAAGSADGGASSSAPAS